MRNVINLMVATDCRGQGGVASVVSMYAECGFLEENQIKLIASHSSSDERKKGQMTLRLLLAICQLLYCFIRYRVGLVHIHMSSRGSYKRKAFIVRLVKFMKIKVILHLHGAEFRDFYRDECNELQQSHIKKTFLLADHVLVLSSQWLTWMHEVIGRTQGVSVLYNAVPSLTLDRHQVQIGRIAFLGRLGARKGVGDLIQAFALVKQRCPEAQLYLAGDGEIETYQAMAEQLGLNGSVHCLGWIAGEAKLKLLTQTDIYCLPSYNEGFPMGVIEAMSAGIPVVASRAGGIPDAISDGEQGRLIEAGDVVALAQALGDLIEQRTENQRIATAAKQKFAENFSLQAVIPRLQTLYDELLKS
ncbi:TPA: exopolysaccharide biosynthesis glycosyltransferase VpsI [Vibrio cholerae]|uniref:exopolysaccharide biosynthesis glycosyltransferase VpsI n=1 Tax=Vibrio cholerae TaxID=666 RepID=UPI0018F093A5|nr:exopolysaccharide biosynthesis glycosyltransferase VpsI [Vibrio cholerae]EKF9406073.1 exopolysaccharide biosynthesis glycosyltransferase VpsI [Vibrio cholerae]EKF9577553.1 exopolysaccharide biosynthesis glycosyltransferase VpsI [Vibrio cholerae]EKG1751167.1 exopolysaccharide biosynthesis glycosyltransferase VpsI [Vibrio cholerae]ELL7124342.1 exopolysaccharide biosynthesis glycosyltransferase VpsI [Vibrio cholerae]ELL8242542.1 exopolysaccharide biosynthesis glycosyltransferase VpsI [Vibrio c